MAVVGSYRTDTRNNGSAAHFLVGVKESYTSHNQSPFLLALPLGLYWKGVIMTNLIKKIAKIFLYAELQESFSQPVEAS